MANHPTRWVWIASRIIDNELVGGFEIRWCFFQKFSSRHPLEVATPQPAVSTQKFQKPPEALKLQEAQKPEKKNQQSQKKEDPQAKQKKRCLEGSSRTSPGSCSRRRT
jgi:hypothetical protein